MERMEIEETVLGQGRRFDLWGQLVKKWARQEIPRPTTVPELIQQCKDAGVKLKVPERYNNNPVQFAQADENTVLLRLPPAALIQASEEALDQPGSYPLPPFYKRIFQNTDPVIPQAQKRQVHDERTGDYSIGNCM